MGSGPIGFLANHQLSSDLVSFTNYCLSWASHAIPLSMVSNREFLLDLKANIFLYLSRLKALDSDSDKANTLLACHY